MPTDNARTKELRACYQRALTSLRQTYDVEFQRRLDAEYEKAGITSKRRASRMSTIQKENHDREA